MRCAKPKRSGFRRRKLAAAAVLILFLMAVALLDHALRPTVEASISLAAQSEITAILCQVAEESIASQEDIAYSTVLYDPNGEIAAVEVSASAVNQLQNCMIELASQRLQEEADATLSVPLGAAGGITLFSGRGPSVRVRIRPLGAVTPSLQSSFEEAGMNQTLHRLELCLTCEAQIIAPLYRETILVTYPCLIAETLLVGDLPAYLLPGVTEPDQ